MHTVQHNPREKKKTNHQQNQQQSNTNVVVKKQERGGGLGAVEEQGVRVEDEEHVRDEKALGEPKPRRAWVSPAPERKRTREKQQTSPTKQTATQRKRDANINFTTVRS